MAGAETARTEKRGRRPAPESGVLLDRELEDLSAAERWREWMLRVEAVIFASSEPVSRETLSLVVGSTCSVDLLIDDLREELRDRPYDIVAVGSGWQHRTRPAYGAAIRAATTETRAPSSTLSQHEAAVLLAIGYFQPVTRGELSKLFGKEISRDTIASLRSAGFLSSGPRSPTPGAPYTYVTTKHFLAVFGFETLRDLPDIEALEDAGLLNRQAVSPADDFPGSSPDDADMGEED